jgi:hypothetical protein
MAVQANSPALAHVDTSHPLSALLSQVLVAFTLELDNEFECRMLEAGHPGTLSLVVWANVMRFLTDGPVLVRDLAKKALAADNAVRFQLGCLERWGFVLLQADSGLGRREGWGSGRGIRLDWTVRLTNRGLAACRIWPPLGGLIERRWERRFGADEIRNLRHALQDVAEKLDIELPHGLQSWEVAPRLPPRAAGNCGELSLPTLLSGLLMAFRLEFERESPVPLELCANTLRVLGAEPIRAAEIPRLTGASLETSGVGWQIKPYVVVEPDPAAGRGKVIRLSPRGMTAQRNYHALNETIGKRWEERFGKQAIGRLCDALQGLFDQHDEDGPLLAKGLVPAPGTVRSGDLAPALGRRSIGAAARQRMRDLVAQTEAFISDPAGALPHYPLWDMNRGFGP